MSASFQFYQTNGAAPGADTAQGTGTGSNDWDFKSADAAGPASAGEEIIAGDFSYHIYVKAKFGGSFTSITNVLYYASDVNLSGAGVGAYVLASGIEVGSYSTPSNSSMSGTWDTVPIVSTSGVDASTAALAGGATGFTDYVGLQLKTTTSGALAGLSSYTSFTLVYDEV